MVPMRDGVRLATDVHLPQGADRVPAVLVRLPYDKCGRYTFMPQIAPFFRDRGYAFVVQDVRGKFRSEGETVAFVREVEDGYDTLEWLVSQAWCDGNVGMWGDSYYGFTRWAAVASEHPALKAIVPRVTSADLAGLFGPETVIPLYLGEYLANYWLDDRIYHWDIDYGHRPLAEVFDPGSRRSASAR
jgi:putative CocE/NonD family hydrolase